jgi:mannitol/fructose-specific phosphotransferase system IIA component (Ntr-type)
MSDFAQVYGIERATYGQLLHVPDNVEAVRQMVQAMLHPRGYTRDEIETTALGILFRENLGSTGIGQGVACPHARPSFMKEPCVGWFVAHSPIDFNALDGWPVHIFICYACPPDNRGDDLRLVELFSSLLKNMCDLDKLRFEQLNRRFASLRDYRRDYIPWNNLGDRATSDPMREAISRAEDARWRRICELRLPQEEKSRLWSEFQLADLDLTFRIDRAIRESVGETLHALEVRVCDLKVWVRATATIQDQVYLRNTIEL